LPSTAGPTTLRVAQAPSDSSVCRAEARVAITGLTSFRKREAAIYTGADPRSIQFRSSHHGALVQAVIDPVDVVPVETRVNSARMLTAIYKTTSVFG
jgi:hypothetical protein